jgi:hypothetical protein
LQSLISLLILLFCVVDAGEFDNDRFLDTCAKAREVCHLTTAGEIVRKQTEGVALTAAETVCPLSFRQASASLIM